MALQGLKPTKCYTLAQQAVVWGYLTQCGERHVRCAMCPAHWLERALTRCLQPIWIQHTMPTTTQSHTVYTPWQQHDMRDVCAPRSE